MNRFRVINSARILVSAAILALAFTILFWGNFASLASAHSHLKSATVSPQATVNKAPSSITLTFGEESSLKETRIQVLDSQGNDVSNGPATSNPGDAKVWTVNLKSGLSDGTYTVKYHTLTEDDGGIVDGSYNFTVSSTSAASNGTATNSAENESSATPNNAPATGEGGAAVNTGTKDTSLGNLSIAIALLILATGLLLMRRKSSKL